MPMVPRMLIVIPVANPFKKWSDINPDLPDLEIRVYGPPTTSGTRASYAEMVNQKGYCGKEAMAKAASSTWRQERQEVSCNAHRRCLHRSWRAG